MTASIKDLGEAPSPVALDAHSKSFLDTSSATCTFARSCSGGGTASAVGAHGSRCSSATTPPGLPRP
eukprot:920851-Alexandrium_andersonii.AAC.1